jgi:hypothetical protein
MNTEDKFYFGKHGHPERFDAVSGPRESTKERARNLANYFNSEGIDAWSEDGTVFVANDSFQKAKKLQRDYSGGFFKNVTVKTYQSRPGQPERFAIRLSDLNYAKSQIRSATPERLREIEQELLPLANGGHKEALALLAYLKSEWNERYRGTHSRSGSPERFMRDIPVKSWKKGAEDYEAGITEDSGQFQPYVNMPKSGTLVTRNAPTFKSEAGARKWLSEYLTKQGFSRPGQPERFSRIDSMLSDASAYVADGSDEASGILSDLIKERNRGTLSQEQVKQLNNIIREARAMGVFSCPGQPDKFDASSLNRGDFAEASTSPMLGKLLAAKVMPEGGWRAVQVGSDTLVISFEDADLASDFGRRVATKGYNATSPVQAIGRYWNVEVKNGK